MFVGGHGPLLQLQFLLLDGRVDLADTAASSDLILSGEPLKLVVRATTAEAGQGVHDSEVVRHQHVTFAASSLT